MDIEICKDIFLIDDRIVTRHCLLPALAVKKYPRSYHSEESAKRAANKQYNQQIANWLLAN